MNISIKNIVSLINIYSTNFQECSAVKINAIMLSAMTVIKIRYIQMYIDRLTQNLTVQIHLTNSEEKKKKETNYMAIKLYLYNTNTTIK